MHKGKKGNNLATKPSDAYPGLSDYERYQIAVLLNRKTNIRLEIKEAVAKGNDLIREINREIARLRGGGRT